MNGALLFLDGCVSGGGQTRGGLLVGVGTSKEQDEERSGQVRRREEGRGEERSSKG